MMKNLSFQEKSTLGTLIALMVVGTLYFSTVWRLWQSGELVPPAVLVLALGYTLLLVLVLVGYHVLISLVSTRENEDERDRLINWRAGYISGFILVFGVFTIVLNIIVGGMLDIPLLLSQMAIANGLLLTVLVASVLELTLRLYFYRRGL